MLWGSKGHRACTEPSVVLPADVKLTPFEFGNLQKMDGPMEQCQDPIPASPANCSTDVVSPGVKGAQQGAGVMLPQATGRGSGGL